MIATTSSPKVEWHKGTFKTETEHRRWIYGHSAGYDLVLTLDADEVLEAEDMPAALEYAMNSTAHYIGINGFINFWRSFDFVCLDGFRPFRIYNLNNQNTEQDKECKLRIYHFSTCQSEEIVRFKWKVSGHASELRHNWIDDIYLAWTPENQIQNVHPVAYLPNPIWNAVPFDKNTLPELLKQHPNFNKALV
jgi:hypothetical protein